MIFSLLKYLTYLFLIFLAFCFLRTWQLEHTKKQTIFIKGELPKPAPEGSYKGAVYLFSYKLPFPWEGKSFDSAANSGVNIIKAGDKTKDKYPFKTAASKGLRDKTTEVLAINYDIPQNPLWLRPILDEVVEVAPNEYLGKMHLRIIPGYPFTLTYFSLKK